MEPILRLAQRCSRQKNIFSRLLGSVLWLFLRLYGFLRSVYLEHFCRFPEELEAHMPDFEDFLAYRQRRLEQEARAQAQEESR